MQNTIKRGPGQFQWNRSGWFGGQAGATSWLVLLGCLLLVQGELVGVVALALGLLSNVLGLLLWRRRQTMPPYPALQILLGVTGLSAAVSLAAISVAGSSFSASSGFWFLLLYPALMLRFHLQERATRKAAA